MAGEMLTPMLSLVCSFKHMLMSETDKGGITVTEVSGEEPAGRLVVSLGPFLAILLRTLCSVYSLLQDVTNNVGA